MGKHRRKRDEEIRELSSRLRELENRLKKRKRSRHRISDDSEARFSPSHSRSSPSHIRSSRTRSRSRVSRDRSRVSDDTCRRSRTRNRRTPCRQLSPTPSLLSTYSHPVTPIKDNQKEAEREIVPIPQPEALPPIIENLLGDEGVQSTTSPMELHDSLATRWSAIMINGLNMETKQNILKKYETPTNCSLLNPPKLNEEVAAAINESAVKRDQKILGQQATIAAAIMSVGKVLNCLIVSQGCADQIETLSDAARLMCDIYHDHCITRRSLLLPGLNKEMKELMEQTPVSEYLFGDKLQDKFNAIKAVKKSGQELKIMPVRQPTRSKNLNFRGPQRQQFPRPSGQKTGLKRNNHVKPATRLRRSPPKHHPRRRNQDRRWNQDRR